MEEIRLTILRVITYAMAACLLSGTFWIQIVRGPAYRIRAESNRIRLIPQTAPRGKIFDRTGAVVVDNVPTFNIVGLPQELDHRELTFKRLAECLPGYEARDLARAYKRGYSTPFTPVILVKDVDRDLAFSIAEREHVFPGILVEPTFQRSYVYGNVAAHVLGYVGLIDAVEYTKLREYGYRLQELVGKNGVEAAYNGYLRGHPGGMQVEVNNRGHQVRLLGNRPPESGKDITLTIDIGLSQHIHQLLQGLRGCCVVLDPATGAVLALESSPSYDPNLFVTPNSSKKIRALLRGTDAPFLNRVIHATYPPGSLFKIVVAAAGLDTGQISSHTTFLCPGSFSLGSRAFHCWMREGHGRLNLAEALMRSCNVFFFNTGLALGPDELYSYAYHFGYGQRSGIDIPGEAEGVLPNKIWKVTHIGSRWYDGDTLNFSIGQGYLLATPLQVAGVFVAVANGGKLMRPYVVGKIGAKAATFMRGKDVPCAADKMRIIKNALAGVVGRSYGTGHRAYLKEVTIGAKTGTAQASGGDHHAWFAGFSPADKPDIAFVIFIENGGSGGVVPADIARKIVQYCHENGIIK